MFKMRKIGPLVGTTNGEDLLEFGMFQVLLMEEPSLLLEAVSINIKRVGYWSKGIPDIMVEQDAKLVIEGHDPQLEKQLKSR
jgi:hypothetical protein